MCRAAKGPLATQDLAVRTGSPCVRGLVPRVGVEERSQLSMSEVNESLSSSSSFLLCFAHEKSCSLLPSPLLESVMGAIKSEAKLTFCLCHLVFPVYEKVRIISLREKLFGG